jgi:hypothetical protein
MRCGSVGSGSGVSGWRSEIVLVLVLDGASLQLFRCEVDFADKSQDGFCPEGNNEGSLAIYCLEWV